MSKEKFEYIFIFNDTHHNSLDNIEQLLEETINKVLLQYGLERYSASNNVSLIGE